MSNSEIGESLSAPMERQIRYLGLDTDATTVGISGGKDSRVVCSAMAYAGLKPYGLTFIDRAQEQTLAKQIAEVC